MIQGSKILTLLSVAHERVESIHVLLFNSQGSWQGGLPKESIY